MSEEATKLEDKAQEPAATETKEVLAVKSKNKHTQEDMSGPLMYLILFSLPFGYMVSSLPGQYATHATFAMIALFIICSLTEANKSSRYTGFLFALVWSCAGVLFYNMRGI